MPLPKPTGRLSLATQRFGLPVFTGLVLLLVWILCFVLLTLQRERLINESRRELGFMNDAVAQHAAGLLRSIESDLRVLDLWLRTHPDADPLSDNTFVALVEEMRRASGGLINVSLVSNTGHLHALPSVDGQPLVDVSDREFFLVQASAPVDQPLAAHISRPEKSPLTHQWVLPVSWRNSHGAGKFRLLLASIELERIRGLHDGMRFQPDGTIGLLRSDGIVLSRTPFVEKYLGLNTSRTPMFRAEYGHKLRGSFISDGKVTDGVARVVSYARLDDYPVVVLVTREVGEVLAQYHSRRPLVIGGLAVISLLLGAFALALHRSQRALLRMQNELRHLAATDELTELMNRRALGAAAERELARARRSGRQLAVLALDLDHFKRINDEHGHAIGDQVLSECCKRWQTALRTQDLLGRLGGEEFCVVLPETDRAAARHVAERLRSALSDTPLQTHGLAITTSIGLSLLGPTDTRWDDMLERADQALYQAKADGRNCVREQLPAGTTPSAG